MATTQLYDSNGNPIFSTSAIGSPQQQVSDSNGNIINPAKEDGNLLSIKTDLDKFTFSGSNLLIDGSSVVQPVSQSGSWTVSLASESIEIGKVDQGTPNTLANAWPVELSDGTNLLGTSSHPVRTDPTGTTTQPVSGTVSITANSSVNVNQVGGSAVVTGGASGLLAVGGPVASGSANADNPLKIGGVFNTTQPTVTNGQVVDIQATSRGAAIVATGTDAFNVTVNTALPAGSNTIGAVTQASGPWTSNITQIAGNSIATAASGIAKVGVTDGSGNAITSTSSALDENVKSWLGSTAPTVGSKTSANSVPVVVASDQAAIPVSQSGTWTVRTQDGSGNNLVASSIVGSNRLLVSSVPVATEFSLSGKMFGAAANVNLPTSGTETDMILFANPNGSGKTVILQQIIFNPSANANGSFRIRVYASPTTSANGSSVTVANFNIGNAATASATFSTGPTVSANGTFILAGGQGVGTSSNTTVIIPLEGGLTLPANSKILITGTPTANNEAVDVTLIWAEV